jgi:predicted RNase H-like nuclease (RuvC/YqgF family)
MANVFGILTFIVLGLSAFVAYRNKAVYEVEITTTLEEKAKLAESRKRLKTAQDTLAETIATRTGVDEENVKLTAAEASQQKTNADLKSQVEEKTAKTAKNKEQLDEIREKTSKVGDLKELASKMRQTNADLEELAQSIAANEAKLANLTALNTQTEASANAMKKKFEIYSSVQSLPTLNTRIRTIYPTWGFVTLASGNNAGVVTNSTLDVVRDGAVIAKLLVSAVESSSASASIVPDSIAQDVTLMVGDKVVASTKPVQPEKN